MRRVLSEGALPPAFGLPRSICEAKMGWSILGHGMAVEHEALEPFVEDMGIDLGGELPESIALAALAQCHKILESEKILPARVEERELRA